MKILIATPESVPYVKTGGLADVAGALLRELRTAGEDVSLILPLYQGIREKFKLARTGKSIPITLGGIAETGHIWLSEKASNPKAYFIECDNLFGRPELYGTSYGDYADNALRFAFFSRAVLEVCRTMEIKPDVIHCNDWQTALIPLYLKNYYRNDKYLSATATLYTIHNLGYQGLFEPDDLKYTGLSPDYFTPDGLEFYGKLNFMKAGLLYADLINTVSETYAEEILEKENGFGLDGVLRKRHGDLYGIINGLNYDEWDPQKDPLLPSNYIPDDLKGKARCKKILLKRTGITDERLPLLGFVGRLSSQKGLDLVYSSVEELMTVGANLVILGKGEYMYQNLFTTLAGKFSGRISVNIGFEESLAHLIYAGCDFFLMPSRYEPCGLGQLIAMKYGTVPIARNTGGLADTIQDYNTLRSHGTGFLFTDYTPSAMQDAVKRAVCVFTDRKRMKKMIIDSMQADFSWKIPVSGYLELYRKAVRKVMR